MQAASLYDPTARVAEYMPTGQSRVMANIRTLIGRVAPFDSNVLILGESGTGKEVVARAIHAASHRGERAFVALNCGAIPAELLESELFGHEKGAFTGALNTRKGRFEMAEGGTLFLDEIGDMNPAMQVKLLRVLQERSYERVGSNVTQRCNVRIIAATHRNLEAAIANGQFREDLYYRLNVVPVEMPALRERAEDLSELIAVLSARVTEIHAVDISFRPSALQALQQYRWPGNVRELANLIERMAIQMGGAAVRVDDLPAKYRPADWAPSDEAPEPATAPLLNVASTAADSAVEERTELLADVPSAGMELPPGGMDLREFLESLEQRLIIKALGASEGTVAQAATLLGLRRTTLAEKMRKYGLGPSRETGNVLPAKTGS